MEYYVGQIIEGVYSLECSNWCNSNGYYLEEIQATEDGASRFQIKENVSIEIKYITEDEFNDNFFEIPGYGYYRKQPKGYADAITSLNTAFNMCISLGKLPENTLIFYTKPDFTNEEQLTDEWLVANQFGHVEWSLEEFNKFYQIAVTTWNITQHK